MKSKRLINSMRGIFLCLFLFLYICGYSQIKLDSSFRQLTYISLKSGISLNNNRFSKDYFSSTLNLYGVFKDGDTSGYFLSENNKYGTSPYFSIGVTRQSKRNSGFYFGATYTNYKIAVGYKTSVYSLVQDDTLTPTYTLSEKRGIGIITTNIFRFELLLYKNIKNTHFDIGLVNGDFHTVNMKFETSENVYDIKSYKQIVTGVSFCPQPKNITSKTYVSSHHFEEIKHKIFQSPYIPLSIGVSQCIPLKQHYLSFGARVVYSHFARTITYQLYAGFHFCLKRDNRLKKS